MLEPLLRNVRAAMQSRPGTGLFEMTVRELAWVAVRESSAPGYPPSLGPYQRPASPTSITGIVGGDKRKGSPRTIDVRGIAPGGQIVHVHIAGPVHASRHRSTCARTSRQSTVNLLAGAVRRLKELPLRAFCTRLLVAGTCSRLVGGSGLRVRLHQHSAVFVICICRSHRFAAHIVYRSEDGIGTGSRQE